MQDTPQNSHVHSGQPLLVAGLSVTVIGGVVLIGWLIESPSLVQVLTGAPPMRFNTAGLLLFVGLTFVGLAIQRPRLVRSLGTFVTAVAVATIAEYLLVFDLGIDNLVVNDWTGQGPNPSGRMAVNTALCFLLVGCSLFSLSLPRRSRWQPLLECLCGAVVFAIGIVAAFGYLTGIDGAFGWFGSGGMAIHTALALGVCGGTLVGQSLNSGSDWSNSGPTWLPLPAAIALCTKSCAIWQALRLEDQKETHRAAALRTESLAHELEDRIEEQVAALERMAHRWEVAGPPTHDQWRADASLYLKHYPAFQVIAWVNSAGRICWCVPESGNEAAQDLGLTAEEIRRRTFEAARDQGRTAITPIVELVQGDQGMIAMCPIDNGDGFAGCINAAFRLSVLVEVAGRHDLELGYGVIIFEGSRQILGSPVGPGGLSAGAADRFASVRRTNLRVRVTPTERVEASQRGPLPEIVLVAGIAFAVLASLLIHYTQQARSRQSAAEQAIEALRNSERKFRGIFDQTFQFIGLLSPAGTVLEANRSALAFAGISEAEVIGKPF